MEILTQETRSLLQRLLSCPDLPSSEKACASVAPNYSSVSTLFAVGSINELELDDIANFPFPETRST